MKLRDSRSDSKPPSGVDDEMAVTEATGSGNGRERVDGNGVTTATASLLVTVLEPILEEYAVEAHFLLPATTMSMRSYACPNSRRLQRALWHAFHAVPLFPLPSRLGPPSLSVSQERFR